VEYFYELACHTYEENTSYPLISQAFFTQEEFEKLCIDACNEVLKSLLKAEDCKLCGYYDNYHDKVHLSFEYIIHLVVEELEKKGFKQITFAANFVPFSWGNLFDREDWGDHRDDLDYSLIEGLAKELVEKVSQKIKERDEEIMMKE